MSVTEQLARQFTFHIKDSGGTYVEIGGVTNFSPSPEKNDTDLTDFDSQGWIEHIVASRGLTFDIEGNHKEDSDTGDRDTGQDRLEDLATNMGWDAMEDFKLVGPSGYGAEFEVSVDAPFLGMSTGGGNDDAAGWSASLTMSGIPSEITP